MHHQTRGNLLETQKESENLEKLHQAVNTNHTGNLLEDSSQIDCLQVLLQKFFTVMKNIMIELQYYRL